MRWAVVLAGGVGSRFWPLSTAARPKQFLPLAGGESLLVETVRRILPLVPAERVLIVTSRGLAEGTRQALPMLPGSNVLAEPRAASTAPALAWATLHAARQDAGATIVSLHADWTVQDADGFRAAAARAMDLAEREDVLVTVGAKPDRPETGYGYVIPGQPLGSGHRIERFQEKPSAVQAEALLRTGALWNTGLFAWTAQRFRAEVETHTPELKPALPKFAAGDAEGAFAAAQPISIDHGLWERTTRGAVIGASFGWDDVGSWAALPRVRSRDAAGNVVAGQALAVDAENCVVWSDGGATVLYGVKDLVVVSARGRTLVTTPDKAPDLKKLLDRLPPELAGDRGA